MQAQGLDANVSCSPENFAYATGFVVPSQPLIRHRHAMVIVSASASAAIFAVDMKSPRSSATSRCAAPDLERIQRRRDGVLASQLTELGLAGGKIGMKWDYLPAGRFRRLQAALPKARFVIL